MKKTNYSVTYYLRFLQAIAVLLSAYAVILHFDKINVYVFIFSFYWYMHIGLSTAMHRYFSHRAFKTSIFGSYFLAFWAVLSMVGSPIFWATIHRQHHVKSDTSKDPHSYSTKGVFSILLGLWYNDVRIPRGELIDLLHESSINWAHRYYFKIILVWISLLFCINQWAPVFYYFLPVILSIFLVNLNLILHHKIGYKNFDTNDLSRNNWLMFPLSLGECWHNNHHHFPNHETTRVRGWELDPGIIIIKILKLKIHS